MNHTVTIQFFIAGTPAPGGSKTAVPVRRSDGSIVFRDGRPVLRYIDDGKNNRTWKARVRQSAAHQYRGAPLTGPLETWATFVLERPAAHFVGGKRTNAVREDAPEHPTVKPDATKLWRSTEDALTGILWADDAQVVRETISKRYQRRGEPTGVVIAVRAVVSKREGEGLFAGASARDAAAGDVEA